MKLARRRAAGGAAPPPRQALGRRLVALVTSIQQAQRPDEWAKAPLLAPRLAALLLHPADLCERVVLVLALCYSCCCCCCARRCCLYLIVQRLLPALYRGPAAAARQRRVGRCCCCCCGGAAALSRTLPQALGGLCCRRRRRCRRCCCCCCCCCTRHCRALAPLAAAAAAAARLGPPRCSARRAVLQGLLLLALLQLVLCDVRAIVLHGSAANKGREEGLCSEGRVSVLLLLVARVLLLLLLVRPVRLGIHLDAAKKNNWARRERACGARGVCVVSGQRRRGARRGKEGGTKRPRARATHVMEKEPSSGSMPR